MVYLKWMMNDEIVMAICAEIDDDNALEECVGTNSLLSSDLRLWGQKCLGHGVICNATWNL